jgi:hypothetical protein
METNLIFIKNELNNLLADIKNDILVEKNDIANRLENILSLAETNLKNSKPKPIIYQPLKYNYESETNTQLEKKKLDNFLNEKKILQEQLILTHENNLEKLPIDNDIQININSSKYNNDEYNNNDGFEETYWSPILSDSSYIQMKKFN